MVKRTSAADPFGLTHDIDINGVSISAFALTSIVDMVTHPDPKKWFRFERISNPSGDVIQVETRIDPPVGV